MDKIDSALRDALAFATRAHAGQMRPGGETQMAHVNRVAARAWALGEALFVSGRLTHEDFRVLVCAAVLHDVLEDTSRTDNDLAATFGDEVARTVRAVSHVTEEESDEDYLTRVAAGGRLAVMVKRCDRLDNLESLARAPKHFREVKLAEVEAALPIWRRIDPEGAPEIEALLHKIQAAS